MQQLHSDRAVPIRLDMTAAEVESLRNNGDAKSLLEQSRLEIKEILGFDPGDNVEHGVDKINEILEGES